MNEYRYVFVNEPFVDTEPLFNTEHGVFGERGHSRNGLEFYNDFTDGMRKIFSPDRYTFTSFLQEDLSIIFFINQAEQTFGFFYWCAERFVCPIERLISFSLEEYGHLNEYEFFDKPSEFRLVVKYLGNNNTEEQFAIRLIAEREYLKYVASIVVRDETIYEKVKYKVVQNTTKLFNRIRDNLEAYRRSVNTNVQLPTIDYQAKTNTIYAANDYYNSVLNYCINKYFY